MAPKSSTSITSDSTRATVPALAASTPAYPAVMRGREMTGWLRVDGEHLDGDGLAAWVQRGTAYARSLPPK